MRPTPFRAALLPLLFATLVGNRPSGAQETPATRPIAVAGFAMAPGSQPRDAWLAVAVEEVLCGRLRRVPGLTVIPTARVYQALRDTAASEVRPPELPVVLPLLGARAVLAGQCSAGVRTFELELRLAHPDGSALAHTRLADDDVFGLLDQATRWALAAPGLWSRADAAPKLDAAREALVLARPAASPTALEYYAKAVAAARRGDLRDASYYLTESLGYDPYFRDAILLHGRMVMQGGLDSRGEAVARFRLLSDIARDRGDTLDRINAELGLGSLAMLAQQSQLALDRFERALALATDADEAYSQVAAMSHMCDLYLAAPGSSDWPESRRQQVRRLNLARVAEWQALVLDQVAALGDVLAEGPAANKLALVLEPLERRDEAEHLLRRSLDAARRSGLAGAQATAWLVNAQFLARAQRWEDALDAAGESLKLTAPAGEPAARVTLAEILRGLKRPADALTQFETVLKLMKAANDLEGQLVCLQQAAELRRELGRRADAIRALQEAVDVAHALKSPSRSALAEKLETWKREP